VLLSAFASDGEDGHLRQLRVGEGLVGQSAAEKRKMLITDLPPNTMAIRSGLFEAVPRNVIVLPVLFEDSVKAVIELASLSNFTALQLALLEQLTGSIGIVLNSIEATMQTEELLEQSQQLAAELQTRQNELQQTNEQLAQKAQQLAEQNAEVERKSTEVEQGGIGGLGPRRRLLRAAQLLGSGDHERFAVDGAPAGEMEDRAVGAGSQLGEGKAALGIAGYQSGEALAVPFQGHGEGASKGERMQSDGDLGAGDRPPSRQQKARHPHARSWRTCGAPRRGR